MKSLENICSLTLMGSTFHNEVLNIQKAMHDLSKSDNVWNRITVVRSVNTHKYTIKCMQNDTADVIREAVQERLAGEDYRDCDMADFFEIAGANTESKRIRILEKLNGCKLRKLNANAKRVTLAIANRSDSVTGSTSLQSIYQTIKRLMNNRIWIAPVGSNDEADIKGYMVCRRSVNNVDQGSTRVDYLRTTQDSFYQWKKPFREVECLFFTFESALSAADAALKQELKRPKYA